MRVGAFHFAFFNLHFAFCIFLVFLAGWSIPASADDASAVLGVQNTTAPAGSTADVKLTLSQADGIGALEVWVQYDPTVLKFELAEKGPNEPNAMIEANVTEPGRLKVAMIATGGLSGQGVPLALKFAVQGQPGTRTDIRIAKVRASRSDNALADVPLKLYGGQLTISKPTASPAPRPLAPEQAPRLKVGRTVEVSNGQTEGPSPQAARPPATAAETQSFLSIEMLIVAGGTGLGILTVLLLAFFLARRRGKTTASLLIKPANLRPVTPQAYAGSTAGHPAGMAGVGGMGGLNQPTPCPRCGVPVIPGARFCFHCGTRLQ
jgi:hypothetical protein